ncbi:MAG: fibronectin type protein, partial [Microbacteriaceae bacterium]|nr:fibronectin type protein [Microbacteriaceae bacterium]
MNRPSGWTRRQKTTATAVLIALVAGIPLTVAALHPGFPISDVQLTARDVWVTNGEQLLGGRLNRQIDELNGSVVGSSASFDVLQDGDTLFMHDPVGGRLESVSPATTDVTSAIDVPKGSEISYGGTTIAIVSTDGDVWAIPAVGDLQFNFVSTPPLMKLGKGGHAVVTDNGEVIAVSATKKALYRVATLADEPVKTDFPGVGEFQLTAVGDVPVVLDLSTNEIVTADGTAYPLGDDAGLRLQQVSEATNTVLVATGAALLRVAIDNGEVETLSPDIDSAATDPLQISAPVYLDGCAHAAWGAAQKYLAACDGAKTAVQEIAESTPGSVLEFRVNRSVIALNDLSNGNAWLMDENMRLVDNWDDIIPPEEQESEEEGDEKSAIQSFEDTLAERTDTNRPPTAADDVFGIRPGRTTILSLLDNDTDPDGDVLVISAFDGIAETTGRLDPIDGGRALQFTPQPDFVGTIAFTYTIDDGRGGLDQARVEARVVPATSNEAPIAIRDGGVGVEANQTVSYNVLTDWRDPDGDDLYLVGAAPTSGDLVRFTPDGFVTFTHQTSELGEKKVNFQVSDGNGAPVQGTLTVKVEPTGTLNPIGTPDFATAFTDETVTLEPLLNDLSPSGAQLSLMALEEPDGGAVASFNPDLSTVTFSSSSAGIFYLKYTLAAAANNSVGIIRIDVREKPADDKIAPVAVKDTAYLRGDEPVTVSVLANDVSPSGRVLAVQSVDVAPELTAKGLVVELLESTLVRVTSPAALTEQVNFTYTISDGVSSGTAGITVVPVPALTKHQPPVAANDTAKVRVGDITTLDVLANDFHPDDTTMTLDETLVTPPTDGLAFVSKNTLRFQAPMTPGEYRVDYRVLDPFGETATATAIFTVVGIDDKGNRAPVPQALIGRVLAGGSIRVDIPLDGIDPDGDSSQLLNFPTNPTFGTIVESGTDYFIYEASDAATGTDQFSYEVYDAFGATGSAEIKIAVIPEPTELREPNAVPDSVSIRPGRIAQVDLTANDSDPQSAPIKVSKKLVDVPEGIEATVVRGQYLVITGPDEEQSFTLRYELTNDRGGKTMSYVLVQVNKDAPVLPPSAEDLPVATKDIAGKKSVTVDIFDGHAFNPAGPTKDLIVTVEGPNAGAASLLEKNGSIEVTPGDTRQAIAYRVTNEADNLSAMAFILVPAAVDENFDDPPVIDPNLPIQYVSMGETREWNLEDIVVVPSGRDAWIPNAETVSGVQSDGQANYVDENTLRFTPPAGYRGPAAINFTVFDGDSKKDPKGISANLRLNIVVGDPEFRDMPPEFTTPNAQVEVGESTTLDLRASSGHKNPQILQEIAYSGITGANAGLKADLNGSTLTLSAPRNAKKGSSYVLGVTLRWDKFEVRGTINVTVVGSSRPLPVAVTDALETQRGDGAVTVNALANDSNPYQTSGEELTIIDAIVANTGEPASISHTKGTVTITPNPSLKSGVIEVVYTVQDATEDKDRVVNGTVTLVVSDVPDPVAKPTRDQNSAIGGDHTATFRFIAPAANGKPITSYEVMTDPSVAVPTNCTAGAACVITGLENGKPYRFAARAVNEHGAGSWSPSSEQVTPYGTPAQVAPSLTTGNRWATANITASWPAVAGTGGTTTYAWATSSGKTGSTTGTSITFSEGEGTYTITVTASNVGGKSGAPGTSAPLTVRTQPAPSQVQNVRVTDGGGEAEQDIAWAWDAPANASADQAGEGLTYSWVSNNGARGTGMSATIRNVGKGTYFVTVTATNSG